MSPAPTALLNGLLGAICGVRFRFYVLIPLIGMAFVEVAFLKQSRMGSVVWSAIVLITMLEMDYLIGSPVGTLWRHSSRERVSRDRSESKNFRFDGPAKGRSRRSQFVRWPD